MTYTDKSYTIAWSGQKADQVVLSYVLNGKEFPITKLNASITSYSWNPPNEPDPAHTTQFVFHYVRIKALWRDRYGEGYKNVSTAYSDYFTLAKPGAFVISTQSLPPATVGEYYNVYNGLSHSDDPPVLLFRCLLNKNGSLDLKPFMIVDGRPDVEPREWSHRIVLKDGNGNAIREQKVNVSFTVSLDIEEDSTPGIVKEVDEAFISSTVLWSDNVTKIELYDKGGSVLASRDVSRNPPAVEFTEPRPGDAWEYGKTYKLKWTASDPDGDALSYSLAVSADKTSWIPVAIDVTSNEYEFDTKSMQPGEYYFRVRATDGVLSANDTMEQSISIKGEGSLPPQSGTATPTPTSATGQPGLPGPTMLIGGVIAVVLVAIVLAAAFLLLRPKK